MAPQKGKQGTKGQKQIVEENMATLSFYRNMVLVSCGTFLVITFVVKQSYSYSNIFCFLFALAVYVASYQFMVYMAKPRYTETGQLFDGGVDLNMEGGIAEHVKDLIILTSGCQLLSLLTSYLWGLWLLAPFRGFWLLWKNILAPWVFQPAPPQEQDEKKQKKLERKMKRQ